MLSLRCLLSLLVDQLVPPTNWQHQSHSLRRKVQSSRSIQSSRLSRLSHPLSSLRSSLPPMLLVTTTGTCSQWTTQGCSGCIQVKQTADSPPVFELAPDGEV